MELQYYWRQHQGCPEFSLEVTNALLLWCPILAGWKMERDWNFGWILFWFGDRSHGQGCWHGRGSWS
jgi:hypothetical protein